MSTFPVIYHHGALVQSAYIEELTRSLDPTVRTEAEAGYVSSRARFTRTPRKWQLRFDMTTAANKATIEAFVTSMGVGGASFTWAEPLGTNVVVRFAAPPTYAPVANTNNTRWTITMTMEEV